MNTHTLPPLLPASEPGRAAVASTLPLPTRRAAADDTCTPQRKAYMAVNHLSTSRAVAEAQTHSAIGNAAADEGEVRAETQSNESTSPQSCEMNNADSSPRAATVLQAKLQYALWLDQLTSCVHAESCARAGLRCVEAETREALWLTHQHARTTVAIREEYAQRSRELLGARTALQRAFQHNPSANVIKREERRARHAIKLDAMSSFQLLCVAESTDHMRLSARQLVAERKDATSLKKTAQSVRALELELASRSYYAIPAFHSSLHDLTLIAEGRSPHDAPDDTPLESWRRRYGKQREVSSAPTAVKTQPPPTCGPSDQSTVKIGELYARRHLRYDEEKERLFLEWWKGVGDIWCTQEAPARQQLRQLHAFVASPVRMQAVVVLQRWWRMLRFHLWSQHRQEKLVASLAALPHRHSTDHCRRHLRALETAVGLAGRDKDGGNSDADVAGLLAGLITAATHPRRYRRELDLYTDTLLRKVRAFCTGLGIAPASLISVTGAKEECSLQEDPGQLRLLSHGARERRRLSGDMWRQPRWPLHSMLQSRDVISRKNERHTRVHPATVESVVHGGPAGLADLHVAQQAMAEEAAKAYQRITHQEELERRVWTLSFSTQDASLPSSTSAHCARSPENETSSRAGDAMPSSTPGASTHIVEGPSRSAHTVVSSAAISCSTPSFSSFSVDARPESAEERQCVQRATEAFPMSQRECRDNACVAMSNPAKETSADPTSEAVCQYGAAFDKAAESVCTEQYTTVQQRFTALNASTLNAIRAFIENALNEKADMAAEESEARHYLMFGQESNCFVLQYRFTSLEGAERSLLTEAQEREADIIYDCFNEHLRLLQLE
ncbi:hypothetical protein ABB37_01494 [Leptomonas pyrrhocoris]|uniref:Uncharacterized protein n=1 Tax=Leptomonas pyrrhocoris TaxID=157538 RepID=A0A0M9G938_LEPPY|nr:hypothetical protein ABB37_01494 [Leptomonas pyrrhocoris]XP_015663526.1 hypothetical protein ABB37_01494 [Leptomonas pyrrhocoris]KPA85086.1 hypothetical protein ABB37_01494 [Leptomonas pyrrhocoris]KPA85087.1 hypothetical protein ABB37_01494 [Leptomonas pyrrhocoris]|eukprot:XP_015663525.1 hypothetical protein ABB37_01494 [Leptomonas pyrrhocoris]